MGPEVATNEKLAAKLNTELQKYENLKKLQENRHYEQIKEQDDFELEKNRFVYEERVFKQEANAQISTIEEIKKEEVDALVAQKTKDYEKWEKNCQNLQKKLESVEAELENAKKEIQMNNHARDTLNSMNLSNREIKKEKKKRNTVRGSTFNKRDSNVFLNKHDSAVALYEEDSDGEFEELMAPVPPQYVVIEEEEELRDIEKNEEFDTKFQNSVRDIQKNAEDKLVIGKLNLEDQVYEYQKDQQKQDKHQKNLEDEEYQISTVFVKNFILFFF